MRTRCNDPEKNLILKIIYNTAIKLQFSNTLHDVGIRVQRTNIVLILYSIQR